MEAAAALVLSATAQGAADPIDSPKGAQRKGPARQRGLRLPINLFQASAVALLSAVAASFLAAGGRPLVRPLIVLQWRRGRWHPSAVVAAILAAEAAAGGGGDNAAGGWLARHGSPWAPSQAVELPHTLACTSVGVEPAPELGVGSKVPRPLGQLLLALLNHGALLETSG